MSGARIVLDKALAATPAADVLLASFIGTVLVVWAIEPAEHVTFSNPAPWRKSLEFLPTRKTMGGRFQSMISRRLRHARFAQRAARAARLADQLADERDATLLPLLTGAEALVVTHLLEDLIAARGADPTGDVARTLIIRIYDRLDPPSSAADESA